MLNGEKNEVSSSFKIAIISSLKRIIVQFQITTLYPNMQWRSLHGVYNNGNYFEKHTWEILLSMNAFPSTKHFNIEGHTLFATKQQKLSQDPGSTMFKCPEEDPGEISKTG